MGDTMKKTFVFALVICLLVIAVAAVLSVTYPELQPKFKESMDNTGEFLRNFVDSLTSPIRQAFAKA